MSLLQGLAEENVQWVGLKFSKRYLFTSKHSHFMSWPVAVLLFFAGSLAIRILFTLLKVWWSRKQGKQVKSTHRDPTYQRPF